MEFPGLRSCFFPNYFLARKWPEVPFRQLSAYNSLLMTLDLADELMSDYAPRTAHCWGPSEQVVSPEGPRIWTYISTGFQNFEDNIAHKGQRLPVQQMQVPREVLHDPADGRFH